MLPQKERQASEWILVVEVKSGRNERMRGIRRDVVDIVEGDGEGVSEN